MEVEEKPTKRNTILLGEATWRMKLLLKYVLVDYFHNFRCGLEHCMAFYGMWLNNFKTYQKMFYLFSHVCCYQSVCQLSLLFLGKEKNSCAFEKKKKLFRWCLFQTWNTQIPPMKGYSFIFPSFFFLAQISKSRKKNYTRDEFCSH